MWSTWILSIQYVLIPKGIIIVDLLLFVIQMPLPVPVLHLVREVGQSLWIILLVLEVNLDS